MGMYSCKEISKLSCEDDKGVKRSLLARMNYNLHLFMCGRCREYVSRMKSIDKSLREVILSRIKNVNNERLDSLEKKILNEIHKK